ncbi:Nramp family divalent metal transporter [Maribacter polysaccharolyticus]|uniref:Nramp family divalent metal transporter n=1 Tax=Maribacter polysaccharolyticus TaxID=3020831 RepID=UPI00237F47E0|nr:Nramp family divalent metal transporter [Maribacter polysaccharolyticus]MDE3741780.1 Nramp family divalent metal transporter [Maribacter polysaccharolyticus]
MQSEKKTWRSKLSAYIALFLPGIFLLGLNIGTGSVTSMAKAGADYGMTLLWTILASCLTTFFMINLYGRFTLVTGETALQAFKKHIHPAVGIFFIIALTVGVCGSVMGVMGIVADICYEWSTTIVDGGISPLYFALFFITMVYFIFWNGKTEFFERALAVIVAIMSASFILNFFIMMPPPLEILKGLIPNVPETLRGNESPFLIIASMIGTTVFSGLFIIRTTLVKEAGWELADLKKQRNDALFSVTLMFIISGSIMAAAAGTLHVEGIQLSKASQMIELLQPLAGSFATSIFAVGIVSAGVSSQFPNILMLPWLICDYNESERDMSLPKYRLIVFLISLLGLVVPIFNAQPVFVMIISQALNAIILPLTVISIFYLVNRKDLMGEHKAGLGSNIILALILLFAIFTSVSGIKGVMELIQ